MYARLIKPALDRIAALFLLVLLSPILLIVAVMVVVTLGRPILFRQKRPGLHGLPFTLLKFRTMSETTDGGGRTLPDVERLGALGQFLRATSLDELPELYNVARGDMSLVGPRPLLVQYLARYNRTQARRHEVRPGMTGLTQVRGRNALTWDDKFVLDVEYVDRLSFALDLRILAATISSVVRRQGVNSPGHATAPEFMGPES